MLGLKEVWSFLECGVFFFFKMFFWEHVGMAGPLDTLGLVFFGCL